ncbi:tRNA (adenosine(37)-N6)-threonylcarbamoyltransferase complex dimerization subunit type 1 TsaB [Alphaproteobacteria bacterium]|nr:tRNA (adenosine(37)-N6)-threonylcarbamoyltransferase complex dimerization subunit type 1 TsaB [Alphaproteobacteria bacterium]
MIISIESSSSNLSVALLTKERLIDKLLVPVKNELSEIIIPTIKNFLIKNSITFENISLITIGCGPGSFTGVRVVIAAAKGIKISNKSIKSIGINSLAGLAMSVIEEAKEKNCKYIIASIDTKRDDIFVQLFEVNNLDENKIPFSVMNDIQTIEIQNLDNYILTHQLVAKDILFVGHQSDFLKNRKKNIKISNHAKQIPDAIWVGVLTSYIINKNIDVKDTRIASNHLKPIYVRHPETN